MQSKPATVEQYLASLPPDRRDAINAVRAVILKNLDRGTDGKSGYEEGMQYGMIGYFIPHHVYPPGYHCDPKQPLPFAGLASQKSAMSLYLMRVNGDEAHRAWFLDAWKKTGKKLDMGKSCIRFKKLDDLALDVIGESVGKTPTKSYIEYHEKALRSKNHGASATAGAAKKPKKSTAKPTAKKTSAKKPAKNKTSMKG